MRISTTNQLGLQLLSNATKSLKSQLHRHLTPTKSKVSSIVILHKISRGSALLSFYTKSLESRRIFQCAMQTHHTADVYKTSFCRHQMSTRHHCASDILQYNQKNSIRFVVQKTNQNVLKVTTSFRKSPKLLTSPLIYLYCCISIFIELLCAMHNDYTTDF